MSLNLWVSSLVISLPRILIILFAWKDDDSVLLVREIAAMVPDDVPCHIRESTRAAMNFLHLGSPVHSLRALAGVEVLKKGTGKEEEFLLGQWGRDRNWRGENRREVWAKTGW